MRRLVCAVIVAFPLFSAPGQAEEPCVPHAQAYGNAPDSYLRAALLDCLREAEEAGGGAPDPGPVFRLPIYTPSQPSPTYIPRVEEMIGILRDGGALRDSFILAVPGTNQLGIVRVLPGGAVNIDEVFELNLEPMR